MIETYYAGVGRHVHELGKPDALISAISQNQAGGGHDG